MTDRQLKARIENTPCGTGLRKTCEECIDSTLCHKYVEKGLKNKNYSDIKPAAIIGQIFVNNDKRLQVDTVELENGESLKVLVCDGLTGTVKWIDTTVYYDDNDYCLEGLWGFTIAGLFAIVNEK